MVYNPYFILKLLFFEPLFLFTEEKKAAKEKLTFLSQFLTDKWVHLRYNTLCIYMWTYAPAGRKGGSSWKAARFIMCPSWSGK